MFPTLTVAEHFKAAAGSSPGGPGRASERRHATRIVELFPRAQGALAPDGGQPLRGRAAELAPGHGLRGHAPPAHRSTSCRSGLAPTIVEQLLELVQAIHAQGCHDHHRRAVGERRPDHRPARLLHGEGRGPLLRHRRPSCSTAPTSCARSSSRAPPRRRGRPQRVRSCRARRRRSRDRRADPRPSPPGVLASRGLTKHFGGIVAVDDVTLRAAPGRDPRVHRTKRGGQDDHRRPHLRAPPRRRRPGRPRGTDVTAGAGPPGRARAWVGRSRTPASSPP